MEENRRHSHYTHFHAIDPSTGKPTYLYFLASWMTLFPCFWWSFAVGKTPIPKIGMEADFWKTAPQKAFSNINE